MRRGECRGSTKECSGPVIRFTVSGFTKERRLIGPYRGISAEPARAWLHGGEKHQMKLSGNEKAISSKTAWARVFAFFCLLQSVPMLTGPSWAQQTARIRSEE